MFHFLRYGESARRRYHGGVCLLWSWYVDVQLQNWEGCSLYCATKCNYHCVCGINSNYLASGHAGHNQLNQAEDDTSLPTQFGGLTSIINTGPELIKPGDWIYWHFPDKNKEKNLRPWGYVNLRDEKRTLYHCATKCSRSFIHRLIHFNSTGLRMGSPTTKSTLGRFHTNRQRTTSPSRASTA